MNARTRSDGVSRGALNASSRRAFSLAEVLISLAITGTLLTASLAALDASFKSYKLTTEGASTNVVTRMVMQRMMAMLRTGTEFGPYPLDVLDAAQNPLQSNSIEFVAFDDGITREVVLIEAREAENAQQGPLELWYTKRTMVNGVETSSDERPLLTGVVNATFTLEYEVGPRLRRATVDLTVRPNDYQDARFGGELEVPSIRLVSSVAPRRLD